MRESPYLLSPKNSTFRKRFFTVLTIGASVVRKTVHIGCHAAMDII